MSNETHEKLKNLLSGISPDALKKIDIKKIMSSKEAQDIAKNISASDKEKFERAFMNMSNEDIKKKLEKSDLKGISMDEILKKLR